MAVTLLAHVIAGGSDHYASLRQSELDDLDRSIFSVIWHFVTWMLLLMTVALFWLAKRRNRALFLFILGSNAGFAALFIAYGYTDFGSVIVMPQWIAFLGVAMLMVAGAVRR